MVYRSIVLAAMVLAAFAGYTTGATAQSRMVIGTNPQGSIYYVVGGGIAKLLTEKAGRNAVVQPYAGSSVVLPLVSSGEVTMSLASSIDSGLVYRGAYSEAQPDLRAIARLWPLTYGYMVRRDDKIASVGDLKGKRVVVEIKGNAALADVNRTILATAGLSESDVEAVTIGGLPEGTQGVVEGSIDATAVAVGIPLTQQANANVSGGIAYAAVDGENATDDFLTQKTPGLYLVTAKPAPNRPGVKEPVQVVGFDVYLVGGKDMADEDVTAVLTALNENFADLQKDYPVLRSSSADRLSSPTNTIPYHPASIAYFKENGMWGDKQESHEATLGE